MRNDDEITIDAPPDLVWGLYADVEHWPDWTASVTTVRHVSGDGLSPGARVRVEQPKLPKAVWEVSALDPGRSWTWVSKAPGITSVATHTVEPRADGRTHVTMSIDQRGPLGALFGRLYARLTRSYLAMEAAGLKARSEALADA
jgi:uncharacterized protein YndB with AHSA1/START domain